MPAGKWTVPPPAAAAASMARLTAGVSNVRPSPLAPYAQDSAFLGGSLAAAKMLSDDPYGTTEPVPFLNRQLFVPSLIKPAPAGLVTLLWSLLNDGKDKPGFGDVVTLRVLTHLEDLLGVDTIAPLDWA